MNDSIINGLEPAMPFTSKPEYQYQNCGMTKRETIAMNAMSAMLSSQYVSEFNDAIADEDKSLCARAVCYADALLEELEK